jgi:chromosome partitioning protein
MRTIAVINAKGGSAKTTTALCLAVGLAKRGHRTLIVDADSQANCTMTMLDGATAEPPTLGNVLLDQADIEDAIVETRAGGLHLLPADPQLADVALLLADGLGREHRLKNALDHVSSLYDFVVVDCPPQTSLVVVNVLAAVHELIVPVDAGIYSVAGLNQLQGTVEQVRKYLGNRSLHIAGLLLTRTHNNKATKDLAAQIRAAFGPLVYAVSVPHSVRVEEAHARNRSIIEFDPKSAPARAYELFIDEVIRNGCQSTGNADSAVCPDSSARVA